MHRDDYPTLSGWTRPGPVKSASGRPKGWPLSAFTSGEVVEDFKLSNLSLGVAGGVLNLPLVTAHSLDQHKGRIHAIPDLHKLFAYPLQFSFSGMCCVK